MGAVAQVKYLGATLSNERILMDQLVELVKALAWPGAAVWLGYIFRGEIHGLLSRMSHFKYKDVDAKFDKGLAEAEAAAAKVQANEDLKFPEPETLSKLDQLRRIAWISPRAAIMEAWVLIESAAVEAGLVKGTFVPRTSPSMIIDYLTKSKKLPENSLPLIGRLRQLRNQAAHLPDFALNQEEAERYLELAVKSAEIIRQAKDAG